MYDDPLFVIRIEIPALSEYVAYLRENNQGKLDDATASLKELQARLDKSKTRLDEAVTNEEKT